MVLAPRGLGIQYFYVVKGKQGQVDGNVAVVDGCWAAVGGMYMMRFCARGLGTLGASWRIEWRAVMACFRIDFIWGFGLHALESLERVGAMRCVATFVKIQADWPTHVFSPLDCDTIMKL